MRVFDLHRNLALFVVAALFSGAVMSAGARHVVAAPFEQAAPRTWTVLVGGEAGVTQQEQGPAGAWQFMRFYPDTITINQGDTIVWKLKSSEPHTVTFPPPGQMPPELAVPEGAGSSRVILNPLAAFPQGGKSYDGTGLTGSGQLDPGPQSSKEYSLTFSKAGTFQYFCAFHSMMTGKVMVQAAGSAYPKTQEQIDADAAAMLAADTAASAAVQPVADMETTRPGPNGTTIHEVKVGWGNGTMARMRFGPTSLSIKRSDTVVWVQSDVDTPHTVTLTSGVQEPELVLQEPQSAGPPKLVLNPQVLAPAGGGTYSGTGYFNSGFLWGVSAPIPGPRTYSLTFDTLGTFEYVCALHDMMGMKGSVLVHP
jgi:plastocyanin